MISMLAKPQSKLRNGTKYCLTLTYSRLTVFDLCFYLDFYGSTSAATNVRRELNRLLLLESGITEDEFRDLLVYITNNPNKISNLEESQG
ncbi:hypothetical protein GLOIN_2v1847979 [Rhizophagus irregularis DAOM 181602=DAOM 197198]|nr:hypothetical protein GLOIN_2v1847979 [Rhizophagus irregularis DAOM 181602=DAOM 197198]